VKTGDEQKMKSIAHNMRTTVSIMGLNEVLDPLFDEVAYYKGSERQLQNALKEIQAICKEAIRRQNIFTGRFR
jgi:hypothetical protein